MEELKELKGRLDSARPASWDAMPDIALYMDQLVSYMPRQLIHYEESDHLTSAMVNNYIKDGLLPRADGKRYGQTHLAYLTAICALKQVLSVKEMKTLIQKGTPGKDPQQLYTFFCDELDGALKETAQLLNEETTEDGLARLAFGLALRSYADKLACQRIVALMQAEEEKVEEKKPPKNKSEKAEDKKTAKNKSVAEEKGE